MGNLFSGGLPQRLFHLGLWGVGFTSLTAMVILASPFVHIGDWYPLQNYVLREMIVVIIAAVMAGGAGMQFYRRKKAVAALATGVASGAAPAKVEDDAPVLKDKMKDALATLKSASGAKADFLYDLPWYLLIGPPGAGKTTALVNSGLKFPLSRGATPAAVAGVGGTRYCDWWFTEDAVLIDTAGRYTTQDSDATADKDSWFAFLDLLKKNRPRQPVNGVIVAISLEDLMTLSSAELVAHSNAIRARLLELHDRLKVDFPVYALFTKGDLVAGFMEFFGNLGENARKQVWGATFQTGDKTRNLVGEIPFEFDALLERLNNDLTDRLQEEPTPSTRVSLFGFPSQMAALKRPIFDFLNSIFEPTRYHANATLRGFYFTSGTQEGTPIDQVIGALARSFGAQEIAGENYSGQGKSFFLTDLIKKVIIGEAAWVSTDRSAVRRTMIIKAAAFTVIGLVSLMLATAWWVSYGRNHTLIDNTVASVDDYAKVAGPLPRETVVADADFAKILPLLYRLRLLPAGYAHREESTPVAATFGLNQRPRLLSSAEQSYHIALERMFRSRLVFRMEQLLEANRNNPGFVYEALKVYLMLGGQHAADRDLILNWWRRDWADNLYPGAANADGRKALEEHLNAMLDLEQGDGPLFTLHGPLVEECQKTLARLSVAQRAYALLKSKSRSSEAADFVFGRRGGPDMGLVFDGVNGQPLDDIKVPGFYTYAGFHRSFIARLGGISEQVKQEQWVLGEAGKQSAVAEQYDRLPDDLLQIYTRDYLAAWRDALGKLHMRKLTADRPKYTALSAISAATSPVRQLLESIRLETELTQARPGFDKPGTAKPAADSKPAADGKPAEAAAMPQFLDTQGRAPGSDIEAAFKPFNVIVEGDTSGKTIDSLIANLAEINGSLTLAATNPPQIPQASAQLQQQVAKLRGISARLPAPFADMTRQASNDFEREMAEMSGSVIRVSMGDQVTRACRQVIESGYPFVRGSREVSLIEFGRLFGPGGTLDKFFKDNLAPLADTSKRDWTWRAENATANTLRVAALREFQHAAEIRDAYFQTGGMQPGFPLAVTPPRVDTPGQTVKFEVNGSAVEAKQGSSPSAVSLQWPGASGVGRTAVTVTTEAPQQQASAGVFGASPPTPQPPPAPAVLERNGAWSLFRMLEAGGASKHGDRMSANFAVGGHVWQFQFSGGSIHNPLNLALLREFRCPGGI